MNRERTGARTRAAAFAAAAILVGSCAQSGEPTQQVAGENVPHYRELMHDEAKFDAAMLKCKSLPTYDAMLKSEWCAVPRKAVECRTNKKMCPEK